MDKENIVVAAEDKSARYAQLLAQLRSLVAGESHLVGVLANVSSALHSAFGFFWTGFYLVGGDELLLGPFQGSVACYRIRRGRGVCGAAWQQRRSLVVADVEQFPGHIACSSLSRSEIVVPIFVGSDVVAVIDIDSDRIGTFDDTDREWLERIAALLSTKFA